MAIVKVSVSYINPALDGEILQLVDGRLVVTHPDRASSFVASFDDACALLSAAPFTAVVDGLARPMAPEVEMVGYVETIDTARTFDDAEGFDDVGLAVRLQSVIGPDGVARVVDNVPRCSCSHRLVDGLKCAHTLPCPWHPAVSHRSRRR